MALTPKTANRIRMASFGALTMLVIQFVLPGDGAEQADLAAVAAAPFAEY